MATSTTTHVFPQEIIDDTETALDEFFRPLCGEPFEIVAKDESQKKDIALLAALSFVGDVSWSLTLMVTEETAVEVVKKFIGMPLPFDSADMGDAQGELVNIVAGGIVANLEERGIKAQMSLPTVVRGLNVESVSPRVLATSYLLAKTPVGDLWFKLATFVPEEKS